jgi:hypothetical protein
MKQNNKTTKTTKSSKPKSEKTILSHLKREEKLNHRLSISIDKLDQQIELLREKRVSYEMARTNTLARMDILTASLSPATQLQLSLGDIKKAA